MSLFAWLGRRLRYHHKPRQMPRWIRKRLYEELLVLHGEEEEVRRLLDLPVAPRLSVVDEERVVMVRPSDRDSLALDNFMPGVRRNRAQD